MPIAAFKKASSTLKDALPGYAPIRYSISDVPCETDLPSITPAIGGSPMKVTYYSQILANDQDTAMLDIGLDPVRQSYNKINDLIIFTDGGLNSSQDDTNGQHEVTGSGTIHGSLIPNVGDVFVKKLLEGQTGLFKVTNVNRPQFNKSSHSSVEYELDELVSAGSALYINLEHKADRTFSYVQDLAESGADPILDESDISNRKELSEKMATIYREYIEKFLDRDTKTLLIPTTDSVKMYDHYLSRFVRKLGQKLIPGYLEDITLYEFREHQNVYPIWTILEDRLSLLTHTITDKAVVKPKSKLTKRNVSSSILYSPINLLIFASDSTEDGLDIKHESLPIEDVVLDSDNKYIVYPVHMNDRYVLSSAFYDGTEDLSRLEELLKFYIDDDPIDGSALMSIYTTYRKWGDLQRFYYAPILLLLTDYYIFNIHSTWSQ